MSIHLSGDPEQKRLKQAVEALGRKCTGFECDVGNSGNLRATFKSIWETRIVPDVLLNCAGLNRRGAIEEMTDEKIDLSVFPSLSLRLGRAWQSLISSLTLAPDPLRESERVLCCCARVRDAVDPIGSSWEDHQHRLFHFIRCDDQRLRLRCEQRRCRSDDQSLQQRVGATWHPGLTFNWPISASD